MHWMLHMTTICRGSLQIPLLLGHFTVCFRGYVKIERVIENMLKCVNNKCPKFRAYPCTGTSHIPCSFQDTLDPTVNEKAVIEDSMALHQTYIHTVLWLIYMPYISRMYLQLVWCPKSEQSKQQPGAKRSNPIRK